MIITGRRRIIAGIAVCALALTSALGCVSSAGGSAPQRAAAIVPRHTIEQAVSDEAQRNTIAFDGLGFITGSLGADSFFPPGKVADFWGFQYLRDNDPSEMGHNTDFLTRAALNMYAVLDAGQREQLKSLATSQVASINEYGYRRFTLMKAFRRQLAGEIPTGSAGLDAAAVASYSADLYKLDGRISYQRARVMGGILASLSASQKASLDVLVGTGMTTWPVVPEPEDMRGLSHDEKVAVMTYAGDLFSWYAGDVEADTYFCPERHGTYFGSFYLKDAKAVGNPGYSIPTTMTGEMGAAFLNALDASQRATVEGLVEAQRSDLQRIVVLRRAISAELRKFIAGGTADEASVTAMMEQYGQSDGDMSYLYASAFSKVAASLTPAQRSLFAGYRQQMVGDLEPEGAFLYSQPIAVPAIADTDFLFAKSISTTRAATTLTLSRSAAVVRRGAPVTLSAKVYPATAATGRTLYLERKMGSRWVIVAKQTLTSSSARFVRREWTSGTYYYRVRVASTANYRAATSSVVRVVRR